ncbi:MAG: hypothetical protein LBH62_02365 [Nitrososphaerota archaeon]|jgi:hypothetical protein|uniref:hypothetical protein n=1 Tax=Candidatus Bathycorpusculum sp. TaxID=2994959 RepID=UPI002817863D|nr:hypothetical protein [Candidatus Termiticorpusculum sp.]MCL2256931.1 hypothetical protein [Candidatus Termiticorpusculum sp.]MCL2292938.1 hypothetical protein [Candidatus Termiticorpusculum sp.]MDR0460272.1 hypothetical protein [Nitrososphaerota archaeon]
MFLVSVGFVQAQTITSGVKPGMAFDYTVFSYWSSYDAWDLIPDDLVLFNETLLIELRIRDVSTKYIGTDSICYYIDETTSLSSGTVNLYTGESTGFVGIIGANLNVGDLIHPDGTDGLKILDTTTRSYASGDRAVNHVRVVDGDKKSDYISTRDLYFDKVTGVLVEQLDRVETNTYPNSVSQVTWKINSTFDIENWVVSEHPITIADSFSQPSDKNSVFSNIYLLVAIVVAVPIVLTVFVIMFYKKKKHK